MANSPKTQGQDYWLLNSDNLANASNRKHILFKGDLFYNFLAFNDGVFQSQENITTSSNFRKTMMSNTPSPTVKLSVLAKSEALKPPARSVMPTLIKLRPIAVMTIPVVSGVIIRFKRFTNKLNTISTDAPAIVKPNSRARISSGVPPFAFT